MHNLAFKFSSFNAETKPSLCVLHNTCVILNSKIFGDGIIDFLPTFLITSKEVDFYGRKQIHKKIT